MNFSTDYQGALKIVRSRFEGAEHYLALTALELTLRYHKGFRKDGITPEWFHQISIILFLWPLKPLLVDNRNRNPSFASRSEWEAYVDSGTTVPKSFAEIVFCAVLLHDIVEDYDYPLEAIRKTFGDEIADAVEFLSKIVPGSPKKNPVAYFQGMGTNLVAAIVKGADRIHNFQTMAGVFTVEKQARYIAEGDTYLLPMLKFARKKFPAYKGLFEIIKHVMLLEMRLISQGLDNDIDPEDNEINND